MVMTSLEISSIIAGQQAMFANNAAYSRQLSGAYNTGPQVPPQMAQNPFPSYSAPMHQKWDPTSAASMMGHAPGMALSAATTVGSLGWGGSMLRPFDTWTRGANAFRAGAGVAEGAGFFSSLGQLGSMGIRAGTGAAMRGIGAAAIASAPLFLAGEALDVTGRHIAAGVQQTQQVSGIMGQLDPVLGVGNQHGRLGRDQIKGMVDVLHGMASEEMFGSVKELTSLMDKFAKNGQLNHVTSAEGFKVKFSKLARQASAVAKILGTTMEEAAPLLDNMNNMGLWRTSDIVGTTAAMKAVGAQSAPALMQTMTAGARQSWQRGGSLASGAKMGRQTFLQTQAAMEAGILDEEAISEFTGGLTGKQGQAAYAAKMSGVLANLPNSNLGNLMVAAMGEISGKGKNAHFTGNVDRDVLDQFSSGILSIGDLQRMGQGRINNRNLATSFMLRRSGIGQDMAENGGMTSLLQGVKQVSLTGGFSGDGKEVQTMLLKKMMGLDDRTALELTKLADNMGTITDRANKKVMAGIDESFDALDRKVHSLSGLGDAVGHRVDNFFRPLEQFGSLLSTRLGEGVDDLSATIDRRLGYTERRIPRSMAYDRRMAIRGGQAIESPYMYGGRSQSIVEAVNRQGIAAGVDTILNDYVDNADSLRYLVRGRTITNTHDKRKDEMDLFANYGMGTLTVASTRDIELARRAAIRRGQNRSMENMGMIGKEQDVAVVSNKLSSLMLNPVNGRRMAQIKKSSKTPEEYQSRVIQELRKSGAGDAIDRIAGGDLIKEFNLLAAADTQVGPMAQSTALDFEKGFALAEYEGDPEKAVKAYNKSLDTAAEALRGNLSTTGEVVSGIAGGVTAGVMTAAAAAIAPTGIGLPATIAIGASVAGTSMAARDLTANLFREDSKAIRSALADETVGGAALSWLKSGKKEISPEFQKLLDSKDPAIKEKANLLYESFGDMTEEQKTAVIDALSKGELVKSASAQASIAKRRSEAAIKEQNALTGEDLSGISGTTVSKYKKILEIEASGNYGAQREATRMMEDLIATDAKGVQALAKKSGGSFSRAMSRGARISEMIHTGSSDGLLKKISQSMGTDVSTMLGYLKDEDQAFIKEAVGDNDISRSEASRLKKIFSGAMVSSAGLESKGQKDYQEKLLAELQRYTKANSTFVYTVGDALVKMSKTDTDDLKEQLNALKPISNPTGTSTEAGK